jgi:mRNA interferase MazF
VKSARPAPTSSFSRTKELPFDTVIVAPMTTKGRPYPTRVPVRFKGKSGQIVLDQIRAVDKTRLVKRVGKIDAATRAHVLPPLAKLFAP